MVRFNTKLIILTFLASFTLACASSPWAVERKEQIRTEQAKDFDEKTNIERRLQDLEDGAFETQDGETAALRRRVAELEDSILEGDRAVKEVETQDTNSQVSLWASIAAGVLGIGGLGKATYGKSRSSSAVEGLEIKIAQGALDIDRLGDQVHRRVDDAEALFKTKLAQVASLLQAVQQGLNTPPPAPPTPPA